MSSIAFRISRRGGVALLAAVLLAALLPLWGGDPAVGSTLPLPTPQGYWMVASDGGVFSFGDAAFHGSTGAIKLNQPIVGMASTPSGQGYWMVASDGGIFSFGDAAFHGSTGAIKLNRPIVGMASTPSGQGYWMVASDGGVFSFGDAAFYGSTGAIKLNRPIVGLASTPTGKGYWMVASDGGMFAFGDAKFFGSTGAIKLNKPIVGMAATPGNAGYWVVASDGGLFAFGDAAFYGSAASAGVNDVTAMVVSPTGRGYWQMTESGQVFAFGDAPALGGGDRLNFKVVGATPVAVPGRAAAGPPSAGGQPAGTDPTIPTPPTTVPPTTVSPAEKGRPNVVVVMLDDLRSDGVMDEPLVLPKTKEWLAAGGSTFTEGYSTTSLCCPERATTWSGMLPHNHGVYDNASGDKLDRDWIIPRYMQDAGYTTALVGKFITNWHFATESEGRYELEHWDEYSAFQGGYLDAPFRVKDGPGKLDYHSEKAPYTTDYIADRAVEYIDQFEATDDKPFYLHVTPHAPHDGTEESAAGGGTGTYDWPVRHNDTPVPPYTPTPARTEELTKESKADKVDTIRGKVLSDAASEYTYNGAMKTLLAADEMMDKIMKELAAKGELDNTLVIFTSDNGFAYGDRGLTSKGYPYREHISVPFLVRWPGVFPAASVDTRPVGGEDLLPTLLDAAQYTPPVLGHPLDGKSFLAGDPGKAFKYLEFGPKPGPTPADYEGHRGIRSWATMRTQDWQYIEYYEKTDNTTVNWTEYYDLRADPWQLQNVLQDDTPANDPSPALMTQLHDQLDQLRRCSGAACP